MPLPPFSSAPQKHPVPISQGGTGSATQNFVDLSGSTQTKSGSLILGGSLGTSSTYVPNVYATNLNLNSTASLSGGTAGQIGTTLGTATFTLENLTSNGFTISHGASECDLQALSTGNAAYFELLSANNYLGFRGWDKTRTNLYWTFGDEGTLDGLYIYTNSASGTGTTKAAAAKFDYSQNTFLYGNVTLSDAKDITLGSTTGTKIGTATTQKLGFYNATPIVQPSGDISTALGNLGLVSSGTVSIASISATGTASSSTYLRGDGSWSTVSGGSGITQSINSISTPTSAGSSASTNYIYLVSGTTTLTLPTAVSNTNLYYVKNVGTNTVTIATTSSQTVDGSTTITLPVQYDSVTLVSDNSNWNIL